MDISKQQLLEIAVNVEAMCENAAHWGQKHWGVDDEGDEISFECGYMQGAVGATPTVNRCLCLATMIKVAGGEVLHVDPGTISLDTFEAIATQYTSTLGLETESDGVEPYLDALTAWNDEPSRTHDEVRALAQAVRARAQSDRASDARPA